MKQILLAVSVICAMTTLIAGQCSFDPIAACNRGDSGSRFLYYVRDGCNCSAYWECDRVRGRIVAHRQDCPPCLCFSDDTWTCSQRVSPAPGQVCPTEIPFTETITRVADTCYRYGNGRAGAYAQQYKAVVGDPTSYIWVVNGIEIKLRCIPGTYFDFANLCQCVRCLPGQPCATENPRVFRLNFDNDAERQGIFFDIGAGASTVPGGIVDNGELFNGTGDIAVPFFKNNEFCEFTWSLWFKRDASYPVGEEGLIFNGNNAASGCSPATIRILSIDSTVSAQIVTNSSTASITHNNLAAVGVFHHVVLRYNCTQLDLFVDNVRQSVSVSGPTLRTKCSLLIGHSVDATDVDRYFKGVLDEIRFYRRALSNADVNRLFTSPGSNP